MRVSSIMRSHVVTLPADATVRMAVDVFDLHQQPVIPVTDGAGALMGCIPLADLARRLAAADDEHADAILAASLRDTMCAEPLVIRPDDDVHEVAGLVTHQEVGAAIVADGAQVIGLIGLPEICRAACGDRC